MTNKKLKKGKWVIWYYELDGSIRKTVPTIKRYAVREFYDGGAVAIEKAKGFRKRIRVKHGYAELLLHRKLIRANQGSWENIPWTIKLIIFLVSIDIIIDILLILFT
ncbi:MAG: hypothetical protein PHT07_15000 [Paludibacter sp.]|nr:hypothetical protein [Paludibacter sp.]